MGDILYNRGAVTFNLVISFVLVLPIGWLLLARFRRAIEQLMRGTTSTPPSEHGVRRSFSLALKLRVQRAETLGRLLRLPLGPLARAAFVELAGGLVFGVVAALLVLLFAGFEILPVRFIAVTVVFAGVRMAFHSGSELNVGIRPTTAGRYNRGFRGGHRLDLPCFRIE
jgi:hypothetical protein